jgi:hypothetical protein
MVELISAFFEVNNGIDYCATAGVGKSKVGCGLVKGYLIWIDDSL